MKSASSPPRHIVSILLVSRFYEWKCLRNFGDALVCHVTLHTAFRYSNVKYIQHVAYGNKRMVLTNSTSSTGDEPSYHPLIFSERCKGILATSQHDSADESNL